MTAPFWILVTIVLGGGLLVAWIADSVDDVRRAKQAALNVQAADFGEPSRQQVEDDSDLPITDDGCDDWERPVIGLRNRMADIRAQIAANHEREVERLRSELECDAAVVLWLEGGAA